jgi:hypothetical protein
LFETIDDPKARASLAAVMAEADEVVEKGQNAQKTDNRETQSRWVFALSSFDERHP